MGNGDSEVAGDGYPDILDRYEEYVVVDLGESHWVLFDATAVGLLVLDGASEEDLASLRESLIRLGSRVMTREELALFLASGERPR